MLEDIVDVQIPEPVEVTTGEPKGETPKVDQPLTEEKVSQMLDAKAEELKRHYQSVADRGIRAAQKGEGIAKRKAAIAESQVNTFNQIAASNPQLAAQVKNAMTAAQAQAFKERENLDMAEQAKQDFFDKMAALPEKFGIDPNDKRLDLANDAEDSIVATDRIMTSISTIIAEDAKKADARRSQELKDFEVRLRKDLGVDSADTTAPSGAGTSSDAEFLTKFGEGDLPYTKENVDRANKIMNK